MRFGHVPLPVGGWEGRGEEEEKENKVMEEEGDRGREEKRRKRQTENQILCLFATGNVVYCKLVCVCLRTSLRTEGMLTCF